jgi:activator of 2-hydroxyglutaryl-CoA dehydratase
MNDKCAAGTGRFLEGTARALEVDSGQFGALSLQADLPASISNLCAVFAESEVVSLIAGGEKRENIIAGIHAAIGSRVAAMAGRLFISGNVFAYDDGRRGKKYRRCPCAGKNFEAPC